MQKPILLLFLSTAVFLGYIFKQYSRVDEDGSPKWHIFDHLGGYSPWRPHITSIDPELPPICKVDHVHMLSRHAERYPTYSVGVKMKALIPRLKSVLPFLDTWSEFFSIDDNGASAHLEELTTNGTYAGIQQARRAGEALRIRYNHLVDPEVAVSVFSCSCSRVSSTAHHFAVGFFGETGLENVRHIVVPDRSPDRAGDTLTPLKACRRYRQDKLVGRDKAYELANEFKSVYLTEAAARLRSHFDHDFSVEDLWTMQELCAFEILATGVEESPWCAIFTEREWEAFAYARDVLHYYRAGYGTPYSAAMGYLYLNATREVIELGPEKAGNLFFSFAHDGDLVLLISALGLFHESDQLPVTEVLKSRRWKLSSVVPMGGRVVFERVKCGNEVGVRLLINDGVMTIPGCQDEIMKGGICPLARFVEIVKKKGEEVGDFEEICGLDDKDRRRPTFLKHDWEVGPKTLHLS